jgi:sulfocyanin
MTYTLTLSLVFGAASVACAQAKDTTKAVKTTSAAPAQASSPSKWLTYDAATNTVTFQLVAGVPGAKSPFNFNGYTDGAATLVVPPKAKVVINFVNEDGTPHSAEIIAGAGPIPNLAGDPAIPRAYTKDVTQGLPQFGKDAMRFTAPDQGEYRIFCGVPGHGLSGMWIGFKVDPGAKAASFGPTKQQ